MTGLRTAAPAAPLQVGDEVSGSFRCNGCDLLITSPRENDGILVLPVCSLCGSEEWRRA